MEIKIGYLVIVLFHIFFYFFNDSINRSNKRTKIHDIPVVILCFHDIDGNGDYSILNHQLISIFDILRDNFIVISLDAWRQRNLKQQRQSKPVVVLTFDDGFPSLRKKVIPLLLEYDFGATFFVYLDRYHDNSRFYKLMANMPPQFEIGSHSFSHQLLTEDVEDIYKELFLSRKKLEYLTKKKITSWAWPYGHYTEKLMKLAEYAGYQLQTSTDYQIARFSDHGMNFPRYTIRQPRPIKQVKSILKHYLEKIERINVSIN